MRLGPDLFWSARARPVRCASRTDKSLAVTPCVRPERDVAAGDGPCGSTNGTLINGVSVVEAVLRGGEVASPARRRFGVDLIAPAVEVEISSLRRFGRLIGSSIEMRRLHPLLERLAASAVPVVIEGETGTGKELLAESLHELGPRASGPFIVFDCTAVAPTLVDSELFGHERGAFTGAVAARRGVFEQAHGGTLLIDEVGDLPPPPFSSKLLRVLERAEFRRVGGERIANRIDVRSPLSDATQPGPRGSGGPFSGRSFPPPRGGAARTPSASTTARRYRGACALVLYPDGIGHIRLAGSAALLRAWEDYSWPGNVRELRNAVARRLALGELTSLECGAPRVVRGR